MRVKLNRYQYLVEKAEQELKEMQDEFFDELENGAFLEGGYYEKASGE